MARISGRDFAGVVVDGPQALIGQDVWGAGRELGFFADGAHAQFVKRPALALYRKRGSVVGINSLLYGVQACAAMLDQFGTIFDQGLFESPLEEGPARYAKVSQGSGDKVILYCQVKPREHVPRACKAVFLVKHQFTALNCFKPGPEPRVPKY